MKSIALVVALSTLVGCSAVEQIKVKTGNDLARTSELAEKYGKPAVKVCSDFLLAQLNSEDSAKGKLDALLKEETEGLLSASLKAALIADLIRELSSPAARAQFEADFKAKCNEVAGDLLIRALRDARTVGSRGIR